jgi:hypothetical protein
MQVTNATCNKTRTTVALLVLLVRLRYAGRDFEVCDVQQNFSLPYISRNNASNEIKIGLHNCPNTELQFPLFLLKSELKICNVPV